MGPTPGITALEKEETQELGSKEHNNYLSRGERKGRAFSFLVESI